MTTYALVTEEQLREVLDVSALSVSDATLDEVCSAVNEAISPLLTPDIDHELHANCRQAALGMAVQVWQSRNAPGGQMIGLDFNPQWTPHLLGAGLVMRFQGLLGPCMTYGGVVVA